MNCVIKEVEMDFNGLIDATHPYVAQVKSVKSNIGIIGIGELVSVDAQNQVVKFDDGLDQHGIAMYTCDTATEKSISIFVHGTIVRSMLKKGTGTPTDADIRVLERVGIWPI
jgi:hypothetical protein